MLERDFLSTSSIAAACTVEIRDRMFGGKSARIFTVYCLLVGRLVDLVVSSAIPGLTRGPEDAEFPPWVVPVLIAIAMPQE